MKHTDSSPLLRAFVLLLAVAAFLPALPAQTQLPVNGTYDFYSDTLYDGAVGSLTQQVSAETVWRIADGVTVTVANNTVTGNVGGGIFGQGVVNTIRIEPLGTTGRVVFDGNSVEAEGSVFNLGMAGANLILNNVSFLNNTAQRVNVGAGQGGGAIRAASASVMTLSNVLFQRNSGRYGGAIYGAGNITVTSGTFIGNFAHGWNVVGTSLMGNANAGYGGAIATNIGSMKIGIFRDSLFNDNWARRAGGVVSTRTRYSLEFYDIVDMSNNFAGYGGAIADHSNTVETTEGILFKYTGTAPITNFVYSGNRAKGVDLDLADVSHADATGSGTFTPVAKGGGFYISMPNPATAGSGAKTRLHFEIADGVTVQIGQPGNPLAWDSIATLDASGTAALLELTGTGAAGAGRLILHADNSYFQGTVNVGTGALLLGNQNASLGGVITVASGATFGGSGTLVTHKQNDTVFAGRTSLTLANGASLTLGTDTAVDAETLYVLGNVTTGTGVTFNHDLFASGSASKLAVTGTLALSGSATINLGLLATGTFTLMEWSGTATSTSGTISNPISLGNFSLTVAGVANSPRSDAALSLAGNSLVATLTTINNLAMKWTGAEGAQWSTLAGAQNNWIDDAGSGVSSFFYADRVVFDGVADAANPANRVITIGAGGVTVSGMEVTGMERYEFRGAGGIEADAGAVAGNPAFTPTGRLVKSGVGELVFANTAANLFHGGIEISGGMVTFNRAAQLGSGTTGIVFSDSGTLRAISTVTGTLTERLTVAAGKTAELKVDGGGALTYGGTLAAGGAGATLRKTGAGAALLTGNNSASTLAFAVDEGSVTLAANAVLGGTITINSGATLAGVGAAGAGGSVRVVSGGILAAGLNTAQSGTLTVHNLALTGGAVLRMDLFKTADTGGWRKSDRILDTGVSAISGANIIDLTSFATGTFNLGNLTDLAADGRVTLSDMVLPAGGRISASLSDNGGVLQLVMTSDQSRVMTWTGGGGSTWNLAGTNWTDNGSVNQYSYGDRVLFAGAADQSILVGGAEVRVADMTVGGDADYTFTGGGIHASAGNVQDDGAGGFLFTDATGKLTKTGNGVLTFANGKNTFLGGIDLAGGVVAVSSGDQLTTSGSTGITFADSATLRAAADVVLDDAITIAAGKTGVMDSGGHTLALKGTLAGAADATLAKAGAGTVVLETNLSSFSGTLAARAGVLRVGAENLLTNGAQSAIVVDSGATLDLDGHNQSISNLSGTGEIALGDAELTYTVAPAGETFAGSFSGSGAVRKAGSGKWTLTGSSSHAGGLILQAGALGLAGNAALGEGALTVATANGVLSIEADGLDIPNAIAAGSGTLTIATNGRGVEFSGNIGGGTVVLDGTGTVALSNANGYSRLEVNTPLAIARRAESAAGTVNIRDGSTLEFRGVPSGPVNAILTGDRVLFTDSTLTLAGQNALKTLVVGAGSRVTAATTGALGGAGADIAVQDGGRLETSVQGTLGRNLLVDGGSLVFGSTAYGSGWRISSIALSGTLDFANGGEVRLGGRLSTGVHNAVVAYGGIASLPAYDANQDGMFMTVDIIDGNLLRITAYDMALEPGKDIAAGFDAMRASMDAVYSHLNDAFLAPLSGVEAPSGPASAWWFRGIGTFAEHESDKEYLGYTDNTYAGVLGYDWLSRKNLMLGGYLGYSMTRLETANDATTDIDLPVFGVYAALRRGNYYMAADLAYATGGADTARRDPLGHNVTGSYDLDSIGASLEAGRAFAFFSESTIRPSVGLQYTTLSFHDHTESGTGAVRLGDIRTDSLQAVLRIDGSKEIKLPWGLPGMVDLGLGWRQNLHNKRTDLQATLVEYPDTRLPIRGDKYDDSTIIARLGIRMMLAKATLFSLSYDYNYIPFGNHRNATRRDTFIATLRQSW
ncbi:hypothetical protein OH491_03255 [Termitidicoccus mucosus]|uniref:Autotransporter domain-containing protein n=1 Tax=Termitidicoccus mucosus TaxID=1184151 RepID=A0A178INX7_9BACT|nr:hypothetical protein AW736_06315 [Opitutaceae bacterium TSB47]